jgi:long-chain acyl-CoA synthetase
VTPGYHELPEVNAEAFDGDWLYTGDIGWVGEDGFYRIEDRIDDMIITGAENVYPAEVEDIVSQHPDVRDVAVIGTEHERLGEAVTAIVVPAGDELTEDDVIDHCRESDELANYKRPRVVRFVDELPKTETRKVDKVSLRDRFD